MWFIGTKREAELDDISPTKLKALKAARNGRNGSGHNDDDSNHKNGDDHVHEEEDDEDDDVCLEEKTKNLINRFFIILGSRC